MSPGGQVEEEIQVFQDGGGLVVRAMDGVAREGRELTVDMQIRHLWAKAFLVPREHEVNKLFRAEIIVIYSSRIMKL